MKRLKVDPEVAETFRAALRACGGHPADLVIAAFDPSNQSMGACIGTAASNLSMQGEPREVMRWARARGSQVHLRVIEEAFTTGKAKTLEELARQKMTPATCVRLGRSAGYIEGVLDGARLERGEDRPALLWRPMPQEWRAVLDLNVRGTREVSSTAATQTACWHVARAHTKRLLEGPAGGRYYDEAMAICMLLAAHEIARAVVLLDQASRALPAGQRRQPVHSKGALPAPR